MFEGCKAGGPLHRIRQRVAQGRRSQVRRRRIRFGAHHGHVHSLRRTARRPRHPHHDPGGNYEAVDDAHQHDFQIGIDANGDLAIDMVLKAYERVLSKWPRKRSAPPPRALLPRQSRLLRRIKATGSIPTPFYTYVHYHGRQLGGVRTGEDGVDVRPPVVPRLRDSGGPGVGLRPGPVRADDGAPEHGDPEGRRRPRVGSESEDHPR